MKKSSKTSKINCHVGILEGGLELPGDPWTLAGRTMPDYFREGSRYRDGPPGIELVIDESRRESVRSESKGRATQYALHEALKRLTRNRGPGPVDDIGLVIAREYEGGPDVLGIMFDCGFDFEDEVPGSPAWHRVPREGCAIFLDAIRAIRGDGDVYHDEVTFSAIHELGHVFNGWHLSSPRSFLVSSSTDDPEPRSAFRFLPVHRKFLSRCVDSPFVHPGGSQFGERGGLGPELWDEPGRDEEEIVTCGTSPPLVLEIGMAAREFWRFEPVELDIRLRVAGGADDAGGVDDARGAGPAPGPIRVPRILDPGYEDFRIWIHEPSGRERLYRSTVRYCWRTPSFIEVAPGRPFERDVTIFGEAGGYTFREPGVYRLRAELDLPADLLGLGLRDRGRGRSRCGHRPPRLRLLSNPLEINVLPPRPRSVEYRKLREVLERPDAARLLFYRDAPALTQPGTRPTARRTLESLRALEDLATRCRDSRLARSIHKTLGRRFRGKSGR